MVTMKNTIQELQQIISEYNQKFSDIPESDFGTKPLPHKWSKKEVLGHLIDSAQNNLRRFICGQYETSAPHIVYDQNFWVEANNYAKANSKDIIALWALINGRISAILDQMPPSNYYKTCNTSSDSTQLRSLEWLAEDYVRHLKHHINQIIPDSFDLVYSA